MTGRAGCRRSRRPKRSGSQVIWDLFHYGSPDCVDQAAPDFPERFTDFALAALEMQQSVSERPPFVCPLNEINFLSWAVDDDYFPRVGPERARLVQAPAGPDRDRRGAGDQAALARGDDRLGRAADPHRAARPPPPDGARRRAEPCRACSRPMTGSWAWPSRSSAAIRRSSTSIGLNFYPHNQWYYEGPTIPMGHHEYRPLADMLVEMAERYRKPVFLSETGAEGIGQAVLASLCLQRGPRRDEPRRRRSRASAGTRSPLIPGWDNSAATPRPGCCRRSSRTAAATSTSAARGIRGRSASCSREAGQPQLRVARNAARAAARPTASRRYGQPSRHSILSISRMRRLLISSSCRWRGRFTSIA